MRHRPSVRFLLYAVVVAALCATMFGQVRVAISIAPPPIPVYEQPLCPGDGYLWTPGYWAYDDGFDDYYWVPGAWVLPPDVGFLWTPPYWAWNGAGFAFYDGYWGPTIGFYGGINYGFGYFGTGFVGGRWESGHFFYNRAVMNVNVTNIHNVYETRITNITENRVSYNGGNGGVTARATAEEEAAARERHVGAVQAQQQQAQAARGDQQLRASVNRGKPPVAATSRAGALNDHPVAAREAGGSYTPRESRPAAETNRPNNGAAERTNENAERQAIHPNELSPVQRPTAPNTGNTKLDQKYQKQQDKMVAQQEKQRQNLQKQQEKEHQKVQKQQANDTKKQQMEQRHQQQTSNLQQRQSQQMQHMQERQAPAAHAPAARPPRS